MLSWKILLTSVAVLFAALGLKASIPLATTHLPLLWTYFLLCFEPLYLFIIINAIIISIVASSRFHHHSSTEPNHPPEPTPPPPPVHQIQSLPELDIPEPPILDVKAVMVNGSSAVEEEEEEEEEEEKGVIDEGIELKRTDSTEVPPENLSPAEKPLVSARFGRRKPPKSTSEGGRALRVVAKAKRHETLENTWKAITEGRPMPLSRHMKKCDTWQHLGNAGQVESTTVSKSETFNERTNGEVRMSAGRLRKEPSLSQDELNRRVEAFIHKFNEEMRLQRQQSIEQYMQMINRGAA